VFRLFLALTLLFFNLYACKGGYNSCKQKIKDSHSIINGKLYLSVAKHKRIIYSLKKPRAKILKYDPFLSLYLVEDKKGFQYPFVINYHLALGVAGVDAKRAIEGRIKKHQIGLNKLATFSEPLQIPSVLLTSCCSLEGIVTPRGIIEKEYIDHFLKTQKVEYSDIGIRIDDKENKIFVVAINPFLKANPFLVGDEIVEYDGKRVKSAAKLMRDILFCKVGSHHRVKIKRDSKMKSFKVVTTKRMGGGERSDTFMEFLGLHFDKNLKIVKIEPKAQKYQLKLGDKLLQANQEDIKTQTQLTKIISQREKELYLLFERNDFEFFVKVK